MEIKNIFRKIYRWEYLWLCLIVLATLAMHFSVITTPDELILDEHHYIKDARYVIENSETERPEHPPLSKICITYGVRILGDNPWGWRVPSVIAGTIGIILFYFIVRRLKLPHGTASLCTFLFAFENFNFVMSSVAMLDVFFVTLMLAFFLLYLQRQYVLSGIFIGLSALAKLYGAIAAPVLFIHWLLTKTGQPRRFAFTVILAPVSFVALMPLFDFAITREFQNPLMRIQEMLSLSSSLMFSNVDHSAVSRPWEWLLNYRPMAFWHTPHYTGGISLSLWIVMIPLVLFMLYRLIKREEAGIFGFAWFFSTYLLWIPISIITDRVSFVYYFYPTIGALCLGAGYAVYEIMKWVKTKQNKIKIPVISGVMIFLLAHAASFAVMSPVFLRTHHW
jgi:dolichyl-phosphate-mannose-protein mannosyltransferase